MSSAFEGRGRSAGAVVAAAFAVALAVSGCKEEPARPISALKPAPLPVVETAPAAAAPPDASLSPEEERELLFQVEAAEVYGDKLPGDAIRIELAGETARIGGEAFDPTRPEAAATLRRLVPPEKPVLLVPDEDTFLAQAGALLALLDDARIETWLLHPEGKVGYRLALSDERDYQIWLDEITAGKIRIIHRADGYELQTNIGKLPGPDANGPSVPRRGGQWDIARLRTSLQALTRRFDAETESCIVPSFGMELQSVARTLSGYFTGEGDRLFPALCLVYPRPRAAEAAVPAAGTQANDAGR